MYLTDFYLNIAEFIIRIYTKENALIYIPEGYEEFIENRRTAPDIEVEVMQGLPFETQKGHEIFRACDDMSTAPSQEGDILWNILDYGDEHHVITSEPYRKLYPYLAAKFHSNIKHWVIYNSELLKYEGKYLLNPLAYPMGPLLLYHLGLYNEAIMFHASGVDATDEGYIFSGFSGVGKSTMAGLWQSKNYKVINDDRLMIRKIEGQYYIFNTPMPYRDIPKKAPLNACFLLKQHPNNYLNKLDTLTGMSKLMAFCIQHHYDKGHITLLMDTLADIANETDLYELGFVPDESVVDLILRVRSER